MKNPDRRQASSGFKQYSFLPELEFNPKFPEPQTLPGQAFSRMLLGERLTQPKFGLRFWRLAAYVKELEYMGWPIERADVPCPPGFGAGRPIREYWLTNDTIQQVKKHLRKTSPKQGSHAEYEKLKKQWDEANPNATPKQRDAAINQIAKKCGV